MVVDWWKLGKREVDWSFYKKFPDIVRLIDFLIRDRKFVNFLNKVSILQ